MARYGKAFKDRAVARLRPPENATLDDVAREYGVGVATLERWRSAALAEPTRERAWSAAARLDAVVTTAAMDEASRSAWCRAHGVYPRELTAWRGRHNLRCHRDRAEPMQAKPHQSEPVRLLNMFLLTAHVGQGV